MGKDERAALQQRMRDRYAVHFSELVKEKKPEVTDVESDDVTTDASSPPETKVKPTRDPRPKVNPPGNVDTDAGESR